MPTSNLRDSSPLRPCVAWRLLPSFVYAKRARTCVQVRLPRVYGRNCRETCLDRFFDACSAPAPGLLAREAREAKRRAGPQTVKGKSRRAWPNNDGSPDGHDEASCCASGQRQAPGSPSILTNASQPTAKYMRGTGRRPRRGSLRMGIGCAPAGSNPRFLAHRIGHRGPACQCRKLCSDRGWGRCTGIRLVGCRAYGAGFTHCPSRVYAMSCIPSHLPRRGIP